MINKKMFWGNDPHEIMREQKMALTKSRMLMERHITSLKSKQNVMEKKLKIAMKKRNDKEAAVYAQHLVTIKENHLKYINLKCEMESIELEVHHALQVNQVTESLGQLMRGVTMIARPKDVVNNADNLKCILDAYKTSTRKATGTMGSVTELDTGLTEEANSEMERMRESIAIEEGSILPNLAQNANIYNRIKD